MIKLIATDIDGTLIQDSTPDLYPEMVEKIKELTARGLIFCGASGRQYYSIRNVFRDVADQIAYIAENGAHIHYQGEDIRLVPMKRDYAEEIIRHIRKFSECDMVVSTPKGALLESKNKDFLHMMEFGYQNKFRLVEGGRGHTESGRLPERKHQRAWRGGVYPCLGKQGKNLYCRRGMGGFYG